MNSQSHSYLNFLTRISRHKKVALFCNQSSFDFNLGKYLFQIFNEKGILKKLILPEHGLFSELQDQIPLDSTGIYSSMAEGVEIISLYHKTKITVEIGAGLLKHIDALVIDIQDTGCRYFTYLFNILSLFKSVEKYNHSIVVYVIDKPNPAGRQVEGIVLPKKYSSLIGIEGIPHRMGLSIGELCLFLKGKIGAKFDLNIIPMPCFSSTFDVQPSPNIPTETTSEIYTGQCLLEGTILSEGRGTTRPFEVFGAPFLRWDDLLRIKNKIEIISKKIDCINEAVVLRPLCFIPTFHKFENEACYGFQVHLTGKKYHSLLYSMILIKTIKEHYPEIVFWREGKYEMGSDKTAIEIILGDETLLDFVNGNTSIEKAINALKAGEESWIKKSG